MLQAPILIEPAITDLGEFSVRRLLPSSVQRSVGPFVFWDHFGPVTLPSDRDMEVRPHPHIGLATLTWLFEGEITHRDGLGYEQDISPGDVNWMTAGRGIVHSERTPTHLRGKPKPLHGLQIWMGLPLEHEQVEPGFQHYPAQAIPRVQVGEVIFDLIAGKALGAESPVQVYSPLFYLAAKLQPGQGFQWHRQHPEEAIYVVEGSLEIDEAFVPGHNMAVLPDRATISVKSVEGARIAIFGGEPIGERFIWWNFVASSRERIREAAAIWSAGGFDRVEGDDEFIPLPENRPMP
ncbi:MAG: redox-sensitive bicupin YhaK (pirin superfamily) [Lysobacterales bacterium]|jgi:redox-sensitive bicupin YhaK (pirin superfamily)